MKSPHSPTAQKSTAWHSQHWTVLKETRKNNSLQEHQHETLVYLTAHSALAHSVTLESIISSNPTSGNCQEPGKHPLGLSRFQFGIQFLFCIFFHPVEKYRYLVRISWPTCEQGFNLCTTSLFSFAADSAQPGVNSLFPGSQGSTQAKGWAGTCSELEATPSSSRACAWRLCNGFPENKTKQKKNHTGVHLNSCRPPVSARNFSGLLANYSF